MFNNTPVTYHMEESVVATAALSLHLQATLHSRGEVANAQLHEYSGDARESWFGRTFARVCIGSKHRRW